MEWSSIIGGLVASAVTGGGIATAFYKNKVAKANQQRIEESELRKTLIDLLPELDKAENAYMLCLRDSMYLHDLEGDIQCGSIPTIRSIPASNDLVEKIKVIQLDLLDNRAAYILSHHNSNFAILQQELSNMQSSQNYGYDDPRSIAISSKKHMEKRLSDLILEFHMLRRQLTLDYFGKAVWSKSNKLRFSELQSLKRQAYNITNWHDQFKSFRRWTLISRVKIKYRYREWMRERNAGD